jgi:phage terminase large subunit-like protein
MPKKKPTDISSVPKKPTTRRKKSTPPPIAKSIRKIPAKPEPEIDISSWSQEPIEPKKKAASKVRQAINKIKDIPPDISSPESPHITNPTPRTDPTPKSQTMLGDIKWSRYIPHIPTPKQYAAMMLVNVKELLFGGALGGGKSDFLAYEALRFCDVPDFTSIIFRRQLTDLKQPKSLIPRVAQWLEPFKSAGLCTYKADDHCWHFKTIYPGTDIPGPPAMLQWGYIGDASIRERYQSAEYHLVEFDELGQWPTSTDWTFMGSRVRATVCPIHGKDKDNNPVWNDNCHICSAKRQIPLRKRAAMNPGPAWVKRRWRIVPDPTVYKTRQQALIAMQEGEKIRWVGTHPYRKFIPSYLSDNPHLSEKDYREMLAEMTPDERSRLEDGNWEARKNARFKRKWIYDRYINLYDHGYSFLDANMQETIILPYSSLKTIFMTVDAAATARLFISGNDDAVAAADGKKSQKPSATCIGVWGVTHEEQLLWLDFRKFRIELPDIVDNLVELSEKWRPQFIKIEANGLGIGVAQYAELAGLPVRKNIRKKDKLENSLSAQMMMKNGQIYLAANTSWAELAEDDVFNWTGDPDEEDDTVDILSDAAHEIALKQAKKLALPSRRTTIPRAVSTASTFNTPVPQYGLQLRPSRYQRDIY